MWVRRIEPSTLARLAEPDAFVADRPNRAPFCWKQVRYCGPLQQLKRNGGRNGGAVVYRGTGTSDDTYVKWRVAAHPVHRIVRGYQQQKCSSSEGKKTGDLTYQFAEL